MEITLNTIGSIETGNANIINPQTLDLTDLYCKINNDNEKIINLYSNIAYTFKFSNTNKNYYIGFFYNFNINTNTELDPEKVYYTGVNNLTKNDNNELLTNITFNLNDINYNYTWIVYEIEGNNHKIFSSGKLKINYPLIFIKLNIINNKLIHNLTNSNDKELSQYLININKNKYIENNNVDIILYENYNYIFEIDNSTNILFFNIYLNFFKNYNIITEETDKYTVLYHENIPKIKKNKYIWSIRNSQKQLYKGKISFVNINNNSNNEKIYDFKFKNVQINNRILYNTFIYKENLNIKNLNNIINNLLPTDSNKLLVINNKNNINISIVLPSINIFPGLTYNILIKHNLNTLNIYCEDNTETKENYDKIKGSIFLINSDNLLYKCILSNTTRINEDYTETNLSENIVLKKIRLNNSNTYNGGLDSYGYIKLICSEYIEETNNYIWNIESKLIGKSILYSNTYLYNAFL